MPELVIEPKTEGESTRHWVYTCLLDNIVDLTLLPGTALGEQDISQLLGISRTPLRDALFQLSQERFVTVIPQSRTLVAKIRLDLVEEARYIRRCVEMDIMRKLAGLLDEEHLLALRYNLGRQELAHGKRNSELVYSLDEEMHRQFFEIAGMAPIWEGMRKQYLHFQRLRNLYHTRDKETAHVIGQHRTLVAALERGDFAEAEAIVGMHLSPEGWDIAAMREEFPEYVD